MPHNHDALPVCGGVLRQLTGYARWVAHLSGRNPDWQADDLTLASWRAAQAGFHMPDPAMPLIWQTHFSGIDWQGTFERLAYLGLSEAEALMVRGEVQGPKRKVGRLYFTAWINVRIEPRPLAEVLACPEGRRLLYERLRGLTPYTPADYAAADAVVFMLDSGIQHLLLRGNALLSPSRSDHHSLRALGFGKAVQVWDERGLSGLMDATGRFLLPCHHGYLSSPSYGMVEVRPAPLPPITTPPAHLDFLNYTCDIIDYAAGRQVNPPGIVVLQGSLGVEEKFVALRADTDPVRPRMGFMDRQGNWLGRADWRDVLLFNEDHAAVQCPDTQLWGFIDRHGAMAIAPRYAQGSFFNRGVAIVPLPETQADDGARWVLIDTTGRQLAGPWHDIEHDRGDTLLVRDGAGRWGLIDRHGRLLVEPIAFAQGTGEDERNAAIRERHRQYRCAQAARLEQLPLAEAVADFLLAGQRDFMDYGLWGRKVDVLRVPEHWRSVFGATTQGHIGWEYPVTASLFDFRKEAPVMLERPGQAPLALGIPWGDLALRAKRETANSTPKRQP